MTESGSPEGIPNPNIETIYLGGEFKPIFTHDRHTFGERVKVPDSKVKAYAYNRTFTLDLSEYGLPAIGLKLHTYPEGLLPDVSDHRFYALTPYDRTPPAIPIDPRQRTAYRVQREELYRTGSRQVDFMSYPQHFGATMDLSSLAIAGLLKTIDETTASGVKTSYAVWDSETEKTIQSLLLELRFNDLNSLELLSRLNLAFAPGRTGYFNDFFSPDGGEEQRVRVTTGRLTEGDPLFLPLYVKDKDIQFRIRQDPTFHSLESEDQF